MTVDELIQKFTQDAPLTKEEQNDLLQKITKELAILEEKEPARYAELTQTVVETLRSLESEISA